VKDENGDLLADSKTFLIGDRTTFLRYSVCIMCDVMQTEIHAAEPLVPGLSHTEVEIAI
jgi:hypothetical protein